MSDLRDALHGIADLAERDAPMSALAPYLREAHGGAAAVSMVAAMVGAMEWAGDEWPGIAND